MHFVAVAFSGGPDSTCLLFLLHRALNQEALESSRHPLPPVAVSIDHGLQEASSAMADHCARFALKHQFAHASLAIPWGEPPFPARPGPGDPFEKIARDARARLILDYMERHASSTLLTGHHLDDQVETLIMGRLRSAKSMNTMEPCRRWGMGDSFDGLGFFGLRGMHKWIARPLLPFSKDRILATCDAHGLEYVVDKTNFQPGLTPRNDIRAFLQTDGRVIASKITQTAASGNDLPTTSQTAPPTGAQVKMAVDKSKIYAAARHLLSSPEGSALLSQDKSILETLRDLAAVLVANRLDLDKIAFEYLRKNACPSHPSTFFLVHRGGEPPDARLRRAIVLRIIRFVSPYPWGSPASQAYRETKTTDRLAAALWDEPHPTKIITHGGLVQWTPLVIRATGKVKHPTPQPGCKPDDIVGWLASRQPGPATRDPAVDITNAVLDAVQKLDRPRSVDVLFDCRFSVHIQPSALSGDYIASLCAGAARMLVVAQGQHCLPALVLNAPGERPVNLPQVVHEQELWVPTPVRVL
ncbi:hypothetical protein AURDEDRAFT_81382 [Auricularia subglabra TFB-10046 SS5]|nr:hypothetical protein AURDEDRAFT_81382 [Auricularia subglabra TFB-10046 SS5]